MKRYRIKEDKWEQFQNCYEQFGLKFDTSLGFESYHNEDFTILKISKFCFQLGRSNIAHNNKTFKELKKNGFIEKIELRYNLI